MSPPIPAGLRSHSGSPAAGGRVTLRTKISIAVAVTLVAAATAAVIMLLRYYCRRRFAAEKLAWGSCKRGLAAADGTGTTEPETLSATAVRGAAYSITGTLPNGMAYELCMLTR